MSVKEISIGNVHSTNPLRAQFFDVCSQSLNLNKSSLSLVYRSSPHSSCCNITNVQSSSDLSEQITINVLNGSTVNTFLKVSSKSLELIKLAASPSSNSTYLKSDIVSLPVTLSLCSFDVPPFEIFLTKVYKGPCKATQYRCLVASQEQWCIDDTYPCNSYQPCPHKADEYSCTSKALENSATRYLLFSPLKSNSKPMFSKIPRTIRGGIVTSVIVLGLLLIIGSVSIALGFLYFDGRINGRDSSPTRSNQRAMIGNHPEQVITYSTIGLQIVGTTEIVLIMLSLMLMNICLLQRI